jgi:hypothetical protein
MACIVSDVKFGGGGKNFKLRGILEGCVRLIVTQMVKAGVGEFSFQIAILMAGIAKTFRRSFGPRATPNTLIVHYAIASLASFRLIDSS